MTEPAPRELLALAVAVRPDWDRDKTWAAMLAARNAGWPFTRTLREVVRLLLIEDSGPHELRIRAGQPPPAPPGSLAAGARAEAIAAAEAATRRLRQQAREREGGTAA